MLMIFEKVDAMVRIGPTPQHVRAIHAEKHDQMASGSSKKEKTQMCLYWDKMLAKRKGRVVGCGPYGEMKKDGSQGTVVIRGC